MQMSGAPRDLADNPQFEQLRASVQKSRKTAGSSTAQASTESDTAKPAEASNEVVAVKKAKVNLMTDESTLRNVDKSVYGQYVVAMGGFPVVFSIFSIMLARTALDLATSRWLAYWSSKVDDDQQDEKGAVFYVGIYSTLSLLTVVFQGVATLVTLLASLRASSSLHVGILLSVTRSPMAFFDVTPLGRIINRFTKVCSGSRNKILLFYKKKVGLTKQNAA